MKSTGWIGLIVLVVTFSVLTTLALYRPVVQPQFVVEAPGGWSLTFLFKARASVEACQSAIHSIANAIRSTCAGCRITSEACVSTPSAEVEKIQSEAPLPFPSSRFPDGVVAYYAAAPGLALDACRQAEEQARLGGGPLVRCDAPNTLRPRLVGEEREKLGQFHLVTALLVLLFSAVASAFVGYLVIRYEGLHARWSHDEAGGSPQKFHVQPTPRIGGLCLICGVVAAELALVVTRHPLAHEQFAFLLIAGLPAFLGGITEDITKSVGVLSRLALTMFAAAIGVLLLGAIVKRVDIPVIDTALAWTPIGIAFTVFAVGGVANAINIIDGYNGLAAGYSIIVLIAFASVAAMLGDSFLVVTALSVIGVLLGFLVWNYPAGKIFLGDGGAYLLGFWLAELCVLLTARHPEVSPWFAMLLVAYPVFETFFSIYRKKLLRGRSPGRPDGLHFHMLIYKRLARVFVGSTDPFANARRNNMVAPYIWTMTIAMALAACFFYGNSRSLLAVTLAFCAAYVWLYRRMVTWRSPLWLIRRPKGPAEHQVSL